MTVHGNDARAPIGVFGGTFDPVHYGHVRPVAEVRASLGLDRVLFIPCGEPPHRSPPQASGRHRKRMLELALAQYPGLEVDDRELRQRGLSYTVITLRSLRSEYPKRSLCMIIGADSFGGLTGWHDWKELFDYTHVVVMRRPGWAMPHPLDPFIRSRLTDDPAVLREQLHGRVLIVDVSPVNVSATRVRDGLAAGDELTDALPPPVRRYIREHGLYRGKHTATTEVGNAL